MNVLKLRRRFVNFDGIFFYLIYPDQNLSLNLLSDGSDTWNRIFGYLENENGFKFFNISATLDIC